MRTSRDLYFLSLAVISRGSLIWESESILERFWVENAIIAAVTVDFLWKMDESGCKCPFSIENGQFQPICPFSIEKSTYGP